MRYGLLRMLRRRQSLLTPNIPKTNYSMLEQSTGIAGVTKATLGPEARSNTVSIGASTLICPKAGKLDWGDMMRYGLLRMLRRRQSLLTPNIPKTNYSMLEQSTGIAGVTKATLGLEGQRSLLVARAFRAGTKPDFVLGGTLHPTVKWAEEDNQVDHDELARIKKHLSEMLQGFGADLIGSRNDGNKVHIKIEGITSLEDMTTIKSLLDSLSTPKRSALFGLPKFLLWCCLKCMFLYFSAMFFKGQMREDEDLVVDKDDDGSPSDDSGRDDSDGSASGGEQEVSKKEAPPSKTSLSKKKNTNEGSSKKKKQKRKKDPNARKRSMSGFMFFSQLERETVKKDIPGIPFTEIRRVLGERWAF
ncbi:FACT complex subunit SSRP1-like protein [Tanacetum coccineum]